MRNLTDYLTAPDPAESDWGDGCALHVIASRVAWMRQLGGVPLERLFIFWYEEDMLQAQQVVNVLQPLRQCPGLEVHLLRNDSNAAHWGCGSNSPHKLIQKRLAEARRLLQAALPELSVALHSEWVAVEQHTQQEEYDPMWNLDSTVRMCDFAVVDQES